MYGNLGCADCDEEVFAYSEDGLGFALPAIGGAISAISGIFGGKPKDTSGTKVYINGLLSQALNGDVAADHHIRCLAGDQSYKQEFGGTCGYAHAEDRAVAQAAVDILNAKGPSSNYAPTQSSIGGPVIAGFSTGPLLLAGAAAFGIFMLTKRR